MDTKAIITVGSAIGAGAVSKGVTGMIDTSNTVKIVSSLSLCVLTGYMAAKVKTTTSGGAALQGAYMGVAVVQGLEAIKAAAGTPAVVKLIPADSSTGRFAQKMLGLSGAAGALNGYYDVNGNFIEDGLSAGYPQIMADDDYLGYADDDEQLGNPELEFLGNPDLEFLGNPDVNFED